MTNKNDKQPNYNGLTYSFYRPHDPKATGFDNLVVDAKTGELVPMPSMTKQSFVEQCDINNILADYKISGQIRHINEKASTGIYADLPSSIDFQESMNLVIAGEAAFATLPSQIRARFGNDPAQFLDFMSDPSNQDEAIKLGLAKDNRPPAPLPGQDQVPPLLSGKASEKEPKDPPPKA